MNFPVFPLSVILIICAADPIFSKEDKTSLSTGAASGMELSTAAFRKKPPTAQEAVKLLTQWDNKLESLKADFKQTVNFTEAGLSQNMEGRIHYLKPDNLRIEHSLPARQIVYTDKKNIWIYKPLMIPP